MRTTGFRRIVDSVLYGIGMASVLAIVSRAVFDEDHPGSGIGDILPIDRYVSKLPVFKKLAKGDAIFLVTVRPGNILWRVAVIEWPIKKKGKAWVGKKNTTPVADASSAVDALKFESGNGVGAAKNALGMALQTPRRLTPGDVKLMRDLGALPAATSGLELVNERLPLRNLAKLPEAQKAQLLLLAKNNRAGTLQDIARDEYWNPMTLWDVRDKATGAITHQLYQWPFGCASVFENDSPVQLAAVIQHAYQMNEGDLDFRRALAKACEVLEDTIDFQLDEEWQPHEPTPERQLPAGPVWRILGEKNVDAVLELLDGPEVVELLIQVCTLDDPHDLFGAGIKDDKGESVAMEHTARVLDFLGELLVRAGVAEAFAERAQAELAKGAQFWLAAIASFGLAKHARKQRQPFPKRFLGLAAKSDFLGHGINIGAAMREVVGTIAPEDRDAFLEEYAPNASTSFNEEIKNNREYEKPCLLGRWHFADMAPSEATLRCLVADMASWDEEPKPTKEVLAIIETIGPAIAPYLREALDEEEECHPIVKKALALVEPKKKKKKK